jgi:two-component sensor histidine kinase
VEVLGPEPSGDRTSQNANLAFVVDISHRRHEEQRMQFIMRELSHRSKNLLAVIQTMASVRPSRRSDRIGPLQSACMLRMLRSEDGT